MLGENFFSAIILAAGRSERMGVNKITMKVGSKSVIERTIEAFEECGAIDEIIIAASDETIGECTELVKERTFVKVTAVIKGGATRQESVKNALAEVAQRADFVAVHDGARPLIKPQAIEAICSAAVEYGAAAAGVKCVDTVKQVDDSMIITKTIDREHTVTVQTPQVFKKEDLIEAHRKADEDGFVGTDDCMLAERIGCKIKVVQSKSQNVKITYPEDVTYMAEILKARGKL